MREIKFRAKTIDNYGNGSKWVYGFLFKTPLTAENFEADSFQSGKNRWCISTEHGVVYEIDEKTVGQFTGILDKNNKEVYEGDLLYSYLDEINLGNFTILPDEVVSEVVFFMGGFILEEDSRNKTYTLDEKYEGELLYIGEYIDMYSVVGNIYDNKNILDEYYSKIDTELD